MTKKSGRGPTAIAALHSTLASMSPPFVDALVQAFDGARCEGAVRAVRAVFEAHGGAVACLAQWLQPPEEICEDIFERYGHTLVVGALAVMAEDDAAAEPQYRLTMGQLLARGLVYLLTGVRGIDKQTLSALVQESREADMCDPLQALAHARRILCELPTSDCRIRLLTVLATAHARCLPLLRALWAEGEGDVEEVGRALLLAALWWVDLDTARVVLRRVPLDEHLAVMVAKRQSVERLHNAKAWESVRLMLQQPLPDSLVHSILKQYRPGWGAEGHEVAKQLALTVALNPACSRETVRRLVELPDPMVNGLALAFADLAMDARDKNALRELLVSLAGSARSRPRPT